MKETGGPTRIGCGSIEIDDVGTYTELRFGDEAHVTYGVTVGDLDGDGYPEVAVANSDGPNIIYLNRAAPNR